VEQIGVPFYVFVREVGPAFAVALAGLSLMAWRPPPRRGLLVTALGLYLLAAVLPYGWLWVQSAFGWGSQTWLALVMTFLRPGLEAASWLLLFAVVVLAWPQGPWSRDSHREERNLHT
jgi:hypothetical protein